MRVLVLSGNFPNPLRPYAGIFVLEQISALRSLGINAVPIAPTPWPPLFLKFMPRVRKYSVIPLHSDDRQFAVERPRVLVLPIGWPFFRSGLVYYLCCRRLIACCVRRQRFDLIHAHTIVPDGFAAVLLGREFNLPVVCTVHGSDVNEYPQRSAAARWSTQWALTRVHRLIAVSEQLKSNIFRLAGERQIEVIRNGADAEVFRPWGKTEARHALRIPLEEKTIVFVGRLTELKAIPVLLAALRGMQGVPYRLYLVGDGELRNQLTRMAAELGVAGRCVFIGARPHEEIPQWLSAADCFVLCSKMEGLPTVIPEAMMCGVPIVASHVGGIPEVIQDCETGLLVPPGDPVSLGRAIHRILTDDALQAGLRRHAAEKARVEFTWKANAEKTAAVYQDAVTTYRTGPARKHGWVGLCGA